MRAQPSGVDLCIGHGVYDDKQGRAASRYKPSDRDWTFRRAGPGFLTAAD
jgi:hypothetical protein